MKKISSKIIISVLLAIFLFGVVNFDFSKNSGGISLEVKTVEAESTPTITEERIGANNNIIRTYSDGSQTISNRENETVVRRDADGNTGRIGADGSIVIRNSDGTIVKSIEALSGSGTGTSGGTQVQSPGWWSLFMGFATIVPKLTLSLFLNPVAATISTVSAYLLSISVKFALNTEIFNSGAIASGIVFTWQWIRDICNITFIFILLWVSIQTIIGIANGKTKKILFDVIIAALLINFSLFIARILVDAGNLVAVSIFNSYPNSSWGLGGTITNILGTMSLWGNLKGIITDQISLTTLILQFVTTLISIWVFLYAAILIAVRTGALIFLMALAPIGFMGNIIPGVSEYSKMWWKNLIGQIMVLPAFLIFVFLIISIGDKFEINESIRAIIKPDEIDYFGWFKYTLIITMLIFAIKITKKLSGVVGDVVGKIAKGIGMVALAVITGGAAIASGGAAAASAAANAGEGAAAIAAARSAGKKRILGGLLTGDINDETGITGAAGRFARSNFITGTKEASNGKLDLAKIEKTIKTNISDEEKRVRKEADRRETAASGNAGEKLDEIEKIEKTIDNQVNSRLSKPLLNEQTEALKAEKVAQEKLAETLKQIDRTPEGSAKEDLKRKSFAHEEELRLAKEKSAEVKSRLDAEKKVKIDEVKKELKVEGRNFDTEKATLRNKIVEGQRARSAYANEIENGKFTLINKKKVAQAIRTQEGRKYKDEEGDLKKMLKKLMGEDGEKSKPATPPVQKPTP